MGRTSSFAALSQATYPSLSIVFDSASQFHYYLVGDGGLMSNSRYQMLWRRDKLSYSHRILNAKGRPFFRFTPRQRPDSTLGPALMAHHRYGHLDARLFSAVAARVALYQLHRAGHYRQSHLCGNIQVLRSHWLGSARSDRSVSLHACPRIELAYLVRAGLCIICWQHLMGLALLHSVFGFTCAQNLFAVHNELKDNSQGQMNLAIGSSIGGATVIYETIGLLGYCSLRVFC